MKVILVNYTGSAAVMRILEIFILFVYSHKNLAFSMFEIWLEFNCRGKYRKAFNSYINVGHWNTIILGSRFLFFYTNACTRETYANASARVCVGAEVRCRTVSDHWYRFLSMAEIHFTVWIVVFPLFLSLLNKTDI